MLSGIPTVMPKSFQSVHRKECQRARFQCQRKCGHSSEGSMSRAQITEESGQVRSGRRRFLNWGKVPAARKHCPALDVVHALHIRARRLALGNGLVREDCERRGRTDVRGIDRVPAIVPIVAHRRGDGLRDPVQSERSAKEIVGRRDAAPRVPLLAEVCGQSRRGVVQSIADGLRLGGGGCALASPPPPPPALPPTQESIMTYRRVWKGARDGGLRRRGGGWD